MKPNPPAPDKSKPCWALTYVGAHSSGSVYLRLQKYVWDGKRWQPRETKRVTSLYKAIEQADWIGHLPQQARARLPTPKDWEEAVSYYMTYKPEFGPTQIARETGLSLNEVRRVQANLRFPDRS